MKRVLSFGFILALALKLPGQSFDYTLLSRINGPVHTSTDGFQRGISASVLPAMIAVPTGIFIYNYCRTKSFTEKKEPYFIAATLGGSAVITLGLKYGIQRPRPFVAYGDIIQKDQHVGSYSFPSGHTSSAFALATSVSLFYPKWYVIVPAGIWACSVAYSRMYLGVHYPTDVVAGALIGSGTAALSFWLSRKVFSS